MCPVRDDCSDIHVDTIRASLDTLIENDAHPARGRTKRRSDRMRIGARARLRVEVQGVPGSLEIPQ
jgi:hypothetical protein